MNLKEKSTHKLKTALQRSPKQQEQMGTFFKCEKKKLLKTVAKWLHAARLVSRKTGDPRLI